ncbi:MAG: hypothetical protein ACTSXJ_06520 [Candidatus Baldrarchaeia archaeon]
MKRSLAAIIMVFIVALSLEYLWIQRLPYTATYALLRVLADLCSPYTNYRRGVYVPILAWAVAGLSSGFIMREYWRCLLVSVICTIASIVAFLVLSSLSGIHLTIWTATAPFEHNATTMLLSILIPSMIGVHISRPRPPSLRKT